jgi:Xaa-Pro dipeptidase
VRREPARGNSMTDNLSAAQAAVRARSLARRHGVMRDWLAANDLDVLIAYGSGQHAFTGTNPAWYLSAFKQLGPHLAVILPRDGEPLLVLTPTWDASRYGERATMEYVAVAPEDFLRAVGVQLKRLGFAGGRTAVAGGNLQPRAIARAWPDMLGAMPIAADAIISDTAKIRDEWSLDCTRRGVAIAEQGYANLLTTTRPGMREFEIAANLEVAMRELGAEDNFQLMSASQHNQAGHFPTDRVLEEGDLILAEITPAVEGEFIQICRSAVIGGPTPLQQEKFALLLGSLEAGMRAAKPGVSVTQIVDVMNAPIAAAGYERYTKPPYMRTRGHSMGLGSMEPEVAPGYEHYMQENMAFVLHPNQYIPETGYMMCGEPVIITAAGAVALTSRMGTLGTIPA